MKKTILCLGLILVFIRCSPTYFYEKGNYKKAFKKASSELNKGKNVIENSEIMESSAYQIAQSALFKNTRYTKSNDIRYWHKAQANYYDVLTFIGKNGADHASLASEAYNMICDEKSELDYKIVDYYYQIGNDLLNQSMTTGEKLKAREAYQAFLKCEKYGGSHFFSDISQAKIDCIDYGKVYFQADGINIHNKLFLERTNNPDLVDCYISTAWDRVSFSDSERKSSKSYTKKIQTGVHTVTDTSGVVTSTPIYEKIKAEVTTITNTVTGTLRVYVHAQNISGQCSYNDHSIRVCNSDSYEWVEISGDHRALPRGIKSSSRRVPFGLESNLVDDLYRSMNRKLGIRW